MRERKVEYSIDEVMNDYEQVYCIQSLDQWSHASDHDWCVCLVGNIQMTAPNLKDCLKVIDIKI